MTFFLFILLVVEFFYFYNRLDKLQEELRAYKQGKGEVPHTPLSQPTQPVVSKPVPASVTVPKPPVAEAPVIMPKIEAEKEAAPAHDLEFKFGSRILTGIGAVAVIIGISFFIRYAFENNLITESMRVILGLIVGIALLAVGRLTWQRYPVYGQIVAGGGIGILYLSINAAFNFYHLVSQPLAFVAMIIITAVGILLAISLNSLPLAGFAQLGGFLTPLLLSTHTNSPHSLFLYITLLNITVVVLAIKKLWRPLAFGSFIGTIFIYLIWHATSYTHTQFALAEFYLTIFFLIFFSVTLVQHIVQKSKHDELDLGFITFNSLFYFLLSYNLLQPTYPEWAGLFTALIAVFHVIVALSIQTQEQNSIRLQQFLLGIAFVLFVIAIPIQFDKFWVTIGWAAEALILTLLGFQIRSRFIFVISHIAFSLTALRLLFFDSTLPAGAEPWLNTRFLTFALGVIIFSVMAYVYRTMQSELTDEEAISQRETSIMISVLHSAVFILLIWIFSADIVSFHYKAYWLPIIWAIGALLGGFAALILQEKSLRILVYMTFILSAFSVLGQTNIVNTKTYTSIFNVRVLTFGIVIACLAGFLRLLTHATSEEKISQHEKKIAQGIVFSGINFLLLWLLSVEVVGYFNKQFSASPINTSPQYAKTPQRVRLENIKNVSLSVTWILYGILLLVFGIIKKSALARILAIVVLGMSIFKVFLFDTIYLNNLYRFVSFITLGLILLITGYLYHRYRDRITHFIQADKEK